MPSWIKVKAKLLLNNSPSRDAQEILTKSFEFFKCDEKVFKGTKRIHSEIKHLIRYAMYVNGVCFEDISKFTFCDRTTIFYAIQIVDDLSWVDKDYSKRKVEYLKYIS